MSNVVIPKTNHNAEYTENVGSLLKSTRLKKGISLQEVSQKTYIKLHYLQALEDDRFDILPAPVYTSGYIRQYAKLLGLEGNTLVQRYHQQASSPVSPPPTQGSGQTYTDFAAVATPVTENRPLPRSNREPEPMRVPTTRRTAAAEPMVATTAPPLTATMPPKREESHTAVARNFISEVPAQSEFKSAQEVLENARRESALFRQNAEIYADQVLGQLEDDLRKTMAVLKNGRMYLKNRLDSYR